MSSGDCCVKANRSWEVTTALWDGRGMGFTVHTHTYACKTHNHTSQRKHADANTQTCTCKHLHVKVKMHAQVLIKCSCPPVPPKSTNTASNFPLQPTDCVCCLRVRSVVDPPRSFWLRRYHA